MPGLQRVGLLIFLNIVAYTFVQPFQPLFGEQAQELNLLLLLIRLAYYSLLLSLMLALLLLINNRLMFIKINEPRVSMLGALLNRLGLLLCLAVMVMMEYVRHSAILSVL